MKRGWRSGRLELWLALVFWALLFLAEAQGSYGAYRLAQWLGYL